MAAAPSAASSTAKPSAQHPHDSLPKWIFIFHNQHDELLRRTYRTARHRTSGRGLPQPWFRTRQQDLKRGPVAQLAGNMDRPTETRTIHERSQARGRGRSFGAEEGSNTLACASCDAAASVGNL
jgi:hypothetical protein